MEGGRGFLAFLGVGNVSDVWSLSNDLSGFVEIATEATRRKIIGILLHCSMSKNGRIAEARDSLFTEFGGNGKKSKVKECGDNRAHAEDA
ncbi:hypothetical protein WG66_016105 [Moniliophthora roreri]|nr:hypothetical protein WG66_016105 [Moniliophthora roreri]